MASNILQFIYCFVVLTVCIDQGDGRWKIKDEAENLQHDIEMFRKMADKIEHEIKDFYDEYPEEKLRSNIKNAHYKHVQNILSHDSLTKDVSKPDDTLILEKDARSSANSNISDRNITRVISVKKTQSNSHVSFINNKDRLALKWPTFEDILLEMGKKYDWKNDRWIKVKEKSKVQYNEVNVIQNNVNFHEKHKFSYRIVKLNRNKRRNVVVAVSAVR